MSRCVISLLCLFLCIACDEVPEGCVSAASPVAADAGWQILGAGGNAADAAVATAFALGVSEAAGSGIGGQSVVILMRPGAQPLVLDGSSFAPYSMPDTVTRNAALSGRRAATVPTTVKILHTLWRDYGSGKVSWQNVLQPAIEAAEQGITLAAFGRHARDNAASELVRDSVAASIILVPEPIVQKMLASTLREIASDPESFYSGRIAEAIADDMNAHGGWITLSDLKLVSEPRVRKALHFQFRGRDVYTLPPPYGGWVVLQALALLRSTSDTSSSYQRELIEALSIAHGSRKGKPAFGENWDETQARFEEGYLRELKESSRQGGETTHLSIADADGMVVGISQSVNYYFGCKVMHPTLGFFYNDYMREFVRSDSLHPFALRPGAIPFSSMSATIVARHGKPELVLGSPGSARIISSVVQVLQSIYDRGIDLGTAVAAPRVHVIADSAVFFESRDEEHRYALEPACSFHTIRPPEDVIIRERNPWFGGIHAVMWRGEEWIGSADPRRDGAVRPEARWDH